MRLDADLRRALAMPLAVVGLCVGLTLFWLVVHPQTAALAALGRHALDLRHAAVQHPLMAVALLALAYAGAVVAMLPVALLMTFAGGYVLGAVGGAVGAIAGATLGALIVYALGRLFPARSQGGLTHRFARLDPLRAAFERHPFRSILSVRLMPLTPFTLISLAAGVGRIGLASFTLGTILGVMPECTLYAAIGAGLTHLSLA